MASTHMTALGVFLLLAGLAIALAALTDVFCSLVRTPLRSGPFTSAAERLVCRGLYRLFRRTGQRDLLAAIGPASVAARALAVLLALYAGWSLVLFADPSWIVVSKTGEPANAWQRLYYVGYTISTLGLGDVVPDAVPARLATVAASATGFTVITFVVGSISPLSDVISDRNSVASTMNAHARAMEAGADGETALRAALDQALSPLTRIATSIETLPVRHRMHAERERMALSLALARLERAIAAHGGVHDLRCLATHDAIDRILAALTSDWLDDPGPGREARLQAYLAADRLL